MKIGETIKKERLKHNYTQEQLGELLYVSRSTISSWEVGRNTPDLDTVVMISDLFNISLDKLLKEDKVVVENTSRKIRHVKIYKIILAIISVFLLCYIGYNMKLRHNEKKYRSNLDRYGWSNKNKDYSDSISNSNGYVLSKNGIDFFTYILPTGFIGIPLEEQKVNVIARKGHLVTDIGSDNKIEVVIASSNDSTVNFSAKVWVNKNVVPIRYEVDTSSVKKNKIKNYLNEHKDEYKKIINQGTKRRIEIVS